ncbi:hypothetical protein ABIA39_005200 [Nocardia sp. GAS34]
MDAQALDEVLEAPSADPHDMPPRGTTALVRKS